MATKESSVSGIVLPAPKSAVLKPKPPIYPPIGPIGLRRSAPAWFYSALAWLGSSYYDATGTAQRFERYLAGSDVDPYAKLGATRLFVIESLDDIFELSIAADVGSLAPVGGGARYPNTDAGILEMYLALSASSVFSSVRYCYVPGWLTFYGDSILGLARNGYDPSTGLRCIVLGSAVAQVVPVDEYAVTQNAQVYDATPTIVPLASAFVYDISQNNELDATTFVLPTFYARDHVSMSSDAVNKLGGATVVFAGGAGFDPGAATTLSQTSTSSATVNGQTLTTTTFATATAITTAPVGSQAMIGVDSFTVTADVSLSMFGQQRILGFYRDATWPATSLGTPIWDFGSANAQLTAKTGTLAAPINIYDPAHTFLSGGSLQNVTNALQSAPYLYGWDRLSATLQTATSTAAPNGVGLAVAGATLDFAPSTAPGPIVDQLEVPVVATVTTNVRPVLLAADTTRANLVRPRLPTPVTVQVGMTGSIPHEALADTGIIGIEIGTALAVQALGDGATIHAATAGTIANLTTSPIAAYSLSLANLGVTFTVGTTYVIALAGGSVRVRGSDQSSSSVAAPAGADASHTYVGSVVYTASTTTVPLYATCQLQLAAPAVGANNVQQGKTYCVRLAYGSANSTSTYDLTDETLAPVASQIEVANPKPIDGSAPVAGQLYFGSFIGGATTMTVWSVPIFVAVVPTVLAAAGASFDGAMTLGAEVSGVPGYQLQLTDSSLFAFTDVNVDSEQVGSVSTGNVFLAAAVINSAPDNVSPRAFAPSKLVLGLVRQVTMAGASKYVFVPAEDSVVIGSTRYITSVIELDALEFDPNARPYPPVAWPSQTYWQFANRHDPYLGVRYAGETQAVREAQAAADVTLVAAALKRTGEPMQLVLDTGSDVMQLWPIYALTIDTDGTQLDTVALQTLTSTVLGLLSAQAGIAAKPVESGLIFGEKIVLPSSFTQSNPYAAGVPLTQASSAPEHELVTATAPALEAVGLAVTNLSPNATPPPATGLDRVASANTHTEQIAAAENAVEKLREPLLALNQVVVGEREVVARPAPRPVRRQPIYGYSIYRPSTGEAYLVQLVDADQNVPDQLPVPTTNATYDPFYVRVVALSTLTSYNMSIIVPALVHDQHGYIASPDTAYTNVIAKANALDLGYVYALADANDVFDSLELASLSADTEAGTPLLTNQPYQLPSTLGTPSELDVAPTMCFACRRVNWSADCVLMQATHVDGTAWYAAYGGGDLVPMRLDAPIVLDKRAPAHLHSFTYTFADQQYLDAKMVSVGNTPYVVAVAAVPNAPWPTYTSASINATAGTASVALTTSEPLQFPTEIYVAGQASTTLTSVTNIPTQYGSFYNTSGFYSASTDPQFQVVTYNGLVYLIRAVADVPALGTIGNLNVTSGLLIDTFVPATTGNLVLAQGARHKRSGLPYFGATYTPTTMVDSTDDLDFTSITGETFYAPTIFIPIAELDATKGFVADISNFIGEQFWTFVYPEIVATAGSTVNGVTWDHDVNIDAEGKPVVSLQKLQFVYDPLVVLFTPNDLAHKYALQPKQQILALSNGQLIEGIAWRSANLQPQRLPPTNVCAQQILPTGVGMDRPNIVYSPHNRPVATSASEAYMGMSVAGIVSMSGCVYNLEESALKNDSTGTSLVSQVSSNSNLVIGVVFEYDNDALGDRTLRVPRPTTKGLVFLNGYLGASGYSFSSPDHFDVNDVVPSQLPLLEQIANTLDFDVAFFNADISLPRDFWAMTYDAFTGPGVPGFLPNVPPSIVDPTFTNRTRSLVLSLQDPVQPTQLGLIDTYSSVVSANLHLTNGVTGAIFLDKRADRDVASIGTTAAPANTIPIFGSVPGKYDFFILSRDHYCTLQDAQFELIDQGYAMCVVDDGSGTGNKVARYYVDADGNYNELYNYALYAPNGVLLETMPFTVKVTLGAPANPAATPPIGETPNNVNPQDIVAQINKLSNLVYAAFGPSSPGQPPAFIPIQAVTPTSGVQALPIAGAPGFNGYALNVAGANRQPLQITQIYSGTTTYPISGSTTIIPYNIKKDKNVPFYGSISHGLDSMVSSRGGNGLGALIGTPFSCAFKGSTEIPPASSSSPGSVMRGDDSVSYTWNAINNTIVDSTGKSLTLMSAQYFVDTTDPTNPIYAAVTLPWFVFNSNMYTVNLSTTASDGVIPRYSLVFGAKSYLFDADNAHVTADGTRFTFNAINSAGLYTVTYAAADAPATTEAPSPIPLNPFAIAMGGLVNGSVVAIDVFNHASLLADIVLGVTGRLYTYDPLHATVTVAQGTTTTVVPIQTGIAFPSTSGYGYVIGTSDTGYTVNGAPMQPYSATVSPPAASYPLMTSPQMFTLGGNFYTFDQDKTGAYVSVTGNQQTVPVNPYQFSINGVVYIIDTSVQPNTVLGGGNVYTMTANNTQFVIAGTQYTITLKQGSLNGATIAGQFDVTQGNVIVIENYVYQIDTLNSQIVGNGSTYPLTSSGVTYTISTADRSFTVTSEPNASTVTIGNIVYQINNTSVVGDGVIYPVLAYRTFIDGTATYQIGNDGVVSLPTPFALSATSPPTFSDGTTYTVNDVGAFDGTTYFRIAGTPPQFTAGARTYTLRNDAVAVTAGAAKTYLGSTTGPLSPNQFTFGTETIYVGRTADLAAFDGQHYYAIANNTFTDTTSGSTFTLSGNTAVHDGNSYEIFSNLGQGAYFQVPGGSVYFVNIPVADTGSASGDIYSVFPVTSGQFTIPLRYTITVSGTTVSVAAVTFTGGATAIATLVASGGALVNGYFTDPITKITYTCVVDGTAITFVDSNNTVYPVTAGVFVASVSIATGVSVAVDNEAPPSIYPVSNSQFVTPTATYQVNVPIAYANAAGPYLPMVNGRFVIANTAPVSNVAYTVSGNSVTKGYPVSADDQFSPDGKVVYTIDAVEVVKATNQPTLSGTTLTDGSRSYTLVAAQSSATIAPPGLTFNAAAKQITATVDGVTVVYTVGATTATDNRSPQNSFALTASSTQRTFTDTITAVTFSFDSSGNNPVTVGFVYTNGFFVDALTGTTYYVDVADTRVEAISYLPATTQYSFAVGGKTYLLHYNDVRVVFPVISGANVNAGVATVGSNRFTVDIDEVVPIDGSAPIPIDRNSFEINGNLYTIAGTPNGSDYSTCKVYGNNAGPWSFTSASSFQLGDPSITYTVQLDATDLPVSVGATFPIQPSRDLLVVDDAVYVISYNTTTTGTLLGQGQSSIAIASSSFTLSNRFDSTKAKFIFADLDIYDAASVVGQFTVYLAPTFAIGGTTYTLDPVQLVVTDRDKRPVPLLPNPMMFGINGANYVLDTNQIPHAVIGNNNISPLSTDVTVQSGQPVPSSTFTLGGLVYALTEDAQHDLLTVTSLKTYAIAQPGLTFKLDTSLLFTLVMTAPAAGNYVGSVVPIGTASAGTLVLNVYPGTPESGGAPFFTYKNVLYTLLASSGTYVAVQKSYTVYAAHPSGGQLQLAVFDLAGTTYIVSDGTTAGATTPGGIHPGTMWAATSVSNVETQFGVVYGLGAQPTSVLQSNANTFQFPIVDTNNVATLYDITYTAGSSSNAVVVDSPKLLPQFTQAWSFSLVPSSPLMFETGGYNAFSLGVDETRVPEETFAAAYKTPITSTDPLVDTLLTEQGDFSVELWHSIPASQQLAYHPFTYSSSDAAAFVNLIDIDFEDDSNIYVKINNAVLQGTATPPVSSSGWRHIALTYEQPYTMMFSGGAGFEVKSAANFDFDREFSIAMTFGISDATATYGLLYKGTGSDNTTPLLAMSYRLKVVAGKVTMEFQDGHQRTQTFTGPSVSADQLYQLIVVKLTNTPGNDANNPDPYTPPFDPGDLGSLQNSGAQAKVSGFGSNGPITVANVGLADTSSTKLGQLLSTLTTAPPSGGTYTVTIAVRTVADDGTFGTWTYQNFPMTGVDDPGMIVNPTGGAHLLFGEAFDDSGNAVPLVGNIRDVYLFHRAINRNGIQTSSGVVDVASATQSDLQNAGLLGYWAAQADPNGIVENALDSGSPAASMNNATASLAPIRGHEHEGAALYVDGVAIPLALVAPNDAPGSLATPVGSWLQLDAGQYRLAEISMWQAVRQPYQILDDMFGRLVPDNEPTLSFYLPGMYAVAAQPAVQPPLLPMSAIIDNIGVNNEATTPVSLSSASIDLAGCPTLGRCGPLITPNLYTPPGVALTVCDTPPSLTTYSVTFNTLGALGGELNEAYVYVKNNVLTLYAGKKVGDLQLSWVSQEQSAPQIIGYIEGAPPAPMANLTNKASYAGATSLTLSAPTTLTNKVQQTSVDAEDTKGSMTGGVGLKFGLDTMVAPFGFGLSLKKGDVVAVLVSGKYGNTWENGSDSGDGSTASNKLDVLNRYIVKLEGSPAPVTNDQFMANLNSVTVPSATVGNPASKTAILPNPNLGGFTSSNPPAALPKVPTEEQFGARMYMPSPYGQAFVVSGTVDVYQQKLVQSGTIYGYVRIPNPQIPLDLNIVSFRMNSQYVRPGVLDGVIGYGYNPATLPSGAQTFTTSTGQMQLLYDKNFSEGAVGHDASYMRIVQAYQLKREIDQEANNALALYQAAYNTQESPSDSRLTPGLDFYNEYIWSARGGTQEVKHTFATSYDHVISTGTTGVSGDTLSFEGKLNAATLTVLDILYKTASTSKSTVKYSYNTTGTASFDISASFDGIERDTQMRYASNNDAHFVMNFNSMFNASNQSGLNLVIGSDGLVYNIGPSVQSGAGLPTSNNLDDTFTYMQPPPAYVSGNADGPTGNLEPYDRPGKVKLFRTYAFFLQPTAQNATDFWESVIDPIWLANSPDSDAAALRESVNNGSIPWRILYRVTYCERFEPPVSTAAVVVPQITPVMAVPVTDAATDFLFTPMTASGPRPLHNPTNDLAANVVLAAPTVSGASAGTIATTGQNSGLPTPPNNIIPFDLVKSTVPIVNWGDTANSKMLTALMTSVLGLNTVPMSPGLAGSTKMADVMDPVTGGPLYTVYLDPNGLTVNVPARAGITVYQDVNGNPIQYYDGKTYHSLQADYIASSDGTVMYYLEPPSSYDQSAFDLLGDYDLFGRPGDAWRYYLVSGASANLTAQASVTAVMPFTSTGSYTGFTVAPSAHAKDGSMLVKGYVFVQGMMQWPNLNTSSETFADVLVYKAMSLLDTFPIGDPEVLIGFLNAQYPSAPFLGNDEICTVFARNITSYFNSIQQALLPQ